MRHVSASVYLEAHVRGRVVRRRRRAARDARRGGGGARVARRRVGVERRAARGEDAREQGARLVAQRGGVRGVAREPAVGEVAEHVRKEVRRRVEARLGLEGR